MFRSSRPRGMELERFFNPRQPISSIATSDLVVISEGSSVRAVTDFMLTRFRRIPLVTNEMELNGLVTITDVLDFLGGGRKFRIYKKKAKGIHIPVQHIKIEKVHTMHPNYSIMKALQTFREHGRGAYPLLHKGVLKGMITEWDFVERMVEPVDVRVEEIMTANPIVAKNDYSVWDATKMMCRGGFRRLPVTDQGILLGIVTPYDILSYLVRGERVSSHKLESRKVKDVMNRYVTTIEPEKSVTEAVELMRNKKVGGLPVIEDEELVGIITERDVLNALVF